VTALAASPWAPLLAVAGPDCVKLIHSESHNVLGLLPFPEGIPFVLRFSRDGAVLLVAGGNPVQSGKVALFEVKTGRRLASYGDETDVVLAADLSADGKFVALGGPGKIVKVFHARDARPAYKIAKHTDWITALEFSPDGSKLATGDRAGGIHVWDAATGGIAFSLSEHKDSITALSWRPDGAILASASEDGGMILWNMKDGWPAQTLNPHTAARKPNQYSKIPTGVLSAQFTQTGQLLSTGRDNAVRLWVSHSEKPELSLPDLSDTPTKATITCDGKCVVIGDARGTVKLWSTADPKEPVTVLK
jgi:WD40 repeat protein